VGVRGSGVLSSHRVRRFSTVIGMLDSDVVAALVREAARDP
jgi:hypothetical protein